MRWPVLRAVKPYLVTLPIAGILVGLTGVVPRDASGQGITQEQAAAILDELRQIRLLLQRHQRDDAARPGTPDQRVTLPAAEVHAIGREDAPLTLVEFTDYECPFCRQFHVGTFEQLKRSYVDTGKVRFVSRDLPLDMHKHALGAAHAVRCAGEQGKYWDMRHVLIVNANRLAPDDLRTYAQDLGLEMSGFDDCVTSGKYAKAIERDMADAKTAGITGTPSFVLGRPSGSGIEGVKLVGALPFGVFETKIREVLAGP